MALSKTSEKLLTEIIHEVRDTGTSKTADTIFALFGQDYFDIRNIPYPFKTPSSSSIEPTLVQSNSVPLEVEKLKNEILESIKKSFDDAKDAIDALFSPIEKRMGIESMFTPAGVVEPETFTVQLNTMFEKCLKNAKGYPQFLVCKDPSPKQLNTVTFFCTNGTQKTMKICGNGTTTSLICNTSGYSDWSMDPKFSKHTNFNLHCEYPKGKLPSSWTCKFCDVPTDDPSLW